MEPVNLALTLVKLTPNKHLFLFHWFVSVTLSQQWKADQLSPTKRLVKQQQLLGVCMSVGRQGFKCMPVHACPYTMLNTSCSVQSFFKTSLSLSRCSPAGLEWLASTPYRSTTTVLEAQACASSPGVYAQVLMLTGHSPMKPSLQPSEGDFFSTVGIYSKSSLALPGSPVGRTTQRAGPTKRFGSKGC